MNTIILNQDFEQVTVSELLSYIDEKELFIFGDSVNNFYIYDCGFKERIKAILDNNEDKWGTESNNIPIIKPMYVKDVVIITVLADLVHVIPQIRSLGYTKFYFMVQGKMVENYFCKELEFYNRCNFDYICNNSDIKYIHIMPDQKFIKPLTYIIEKGFSINEHAFLIYAFNRGNYNDQYDVWSLYERLYSQYKNVSILDGIFSLDKNAIIRMNTLDYQLCQCKLIIVHGEWLNDCIYECLEKHIDKLKEKGVLIPWSGNFGYDECNDKYIKRVLKFCKVICLDKDSEHGKMIIQKLGLRAKKFVSNGLNYSQPIEHPIKAHNRIPKVLVSHSCYSYNKVSETLNCISKFIGNIEVYCITSYGEKRYIEEAEELGRRLFGDSFFSVKKYMSYEDYVSFLNKMDIAVYAMDVGAGNTTLQILCYTGAKLFFKKGSNTYNYAKAQGYQVNDYYSISKLTFNQFVENNTSKNNYEISKENFSLLSIASKWKDIFDIMEV